MRGDEHIKSCLRIFWCPVALFGSSCARYYASVSMRLISAPLYAPALLIFAAIAAISGRHRRRPRLQGCRGYSLVIKFRHGRRPQWQSTPALSCCCCCWGDRRDEDGRDDGQDITLSSIPLLSPHLLKHPVNHSIIPSLNLQPCNVEAPIEGTNCCTYLTLYCTYNKSVVFCLFLPRIFLLDIFLTSVKTLT